MAGKIYAKIVHYSCTLCRGEELYCMYIYYVCKHYCHPTACMVNISQQNARHAKPLINNDSYHNTFTRSDEDLYLYR
jgi:hypothetical protein